MYVVAGRTLDIAANQDVSNSQSSAAGNGIAGELQLVNSKAGVGDRDWVVITQVGAEVARSAGANYVGGYAGGASEGVEAGYTVMTGEAHEAVAARLHWSIVQGGRRVEIEGGGGASSTVPQWNISERVVRGVADDTDFASTSIVPELGAEVVLAAADDRERGASEQCESQCY